MEDIFAVKNIIYTGRRRDYALIDHTIDYELDLTTPVSLKLNGKSFNESSWIHLLHHFGKDLIEEFHPEEKDLLNYQSTWSKVPIFINRASINYKKLTPSLYMCCKFTAKESYTLILDLLKLFKIDPKDNLVIVVHRQPSSEPEEIQKKVIEDTKNEFKNYLMNEQNKTEDISLKIITNIEEKLDPFLRSITRTYNTFFHFDSLQQLTNYIGMYRKKILYDKKIPEKNKSIINRYLNYLSDFYYNYLN